MAIQFSRYAKLSNIAICEYKYVCIFIHSVIETSEMMTFKYLYRFKLLYIIIISIIMILNKWKLMLVSINK